MGSPLKAKEVTGIHILGSTSKNFRTIISKHPVHIKVWIFLSSVKRSRKETDIGWHHSVFLIEIGTQKNQLRSNHIMYDFDFKFNYTRLTKENVEESEKIIRSMIFLEMVLIVRQATTY